MNTIDGPAGERRQGHSDHDDLRISLGAYVLGALDDAEARQVRGHLLDCVTCRAEYGELAEVRTVMDRAGAVPDAHPAPDALPSPADRNRRGWTPRRRRFGLAAAGVLLAGTAGVGGAVLLFGNHSGPPPGTRTVAATGLYGMTAEIQFHPAAWGTWIQVTMSKIPADYTCTLTVVSKSGRVEIASNWTSGPHGGTVTVPGAVAMPAASIDHFDVAISQGPDLLIPNR